MTAPTPGSWLKKTATVTPETTSSPKTQQTGSENSSTPSKNDSQKKRDPKFDRCTCGHQRRDHVSVATNPEEALWDGSYLHCDSCDCGKFKKAPFVRKEHLTNRPFADNTSMILLQDRMHVKEFTPRSKKGKRK